MFGWTVPLSTDNRQCLYLYGLFVLLIIFLLFLKEEMGRPVHRTRNRGVYMALGWTFAKTHNFRSNNKKTVICPPPPPHLVISVANYNFDKSQQCIGSMTIEIDFLQKKSTAPVPTTLTKWLLSLFSISTIRGFTVGQQVSITSQTW